MIHRRCAFTDSMTQHPNNTKTGFKFSTVTNAKSHSKALVIKIIFFYVTSSFAIVNKPKKKKPKQNGWTDHEWSSLPFVQYKKVMSRLMMDAFDGIFHGRHS